MLDLRFLDWLGSSGSGLVETAVLGLLEEEIGSDNVGDTQTYRDHVDSRFVDGLQATEH